MPEGGSIKKRKVSHDGEGAGRNDKAEHKKRTETKKKKKEMKEGRTKGKKVEVSDEEKRALSGGEEVAAAASSNMELEVGTREKRKKVKKVKKVRFEGEEEEREEGGQEALGQEEGSEKEEIPQREGGAEAIEEGNSSTSLSGPSGDGVVPAKTFKELGVMDSLCEACANLGYKNPTAIQAEAIPVALQGKDVIGLAETGSGKTAAFALPILQGSALASPSIGLRRADDLTIALWDRPTGMFACVLAPTRELAFQISEQFEALGSGIGVRCAVIVGGMDMMTQSVALGKMPHIVVATPGRLLDHLENTKGFSLRNLKYLVMDEADRLLDMDFGPILDKILKVIPMTRRTYLFSATMTSKVEKLQRASLSSPVRVSVSSKYSTVSTLIQKFLFIPFKHKDTYLVYLMNEFAGQTIIIFCRTVQETSRLAILLRHLGFKAVPLNGQMSQSARLGALNKFKSGSRNILVATDVAARGLDIPSVDCVINHDLAQDSKTYIHRVGRTARAGRSGRSISIVTQYDVELFLRIEAALGKKIPELEVREEDVLIFSERVGEAQREAAKDLREEREKKGGRREGRSGGKGGNEGKGGKRRRDEMDREEE